jgi:hypothetical protein
MYLVLQDNAFMANVCRWKQNKSTEVVRYGALYFCPILIKLSQQIFVEARNIKFHGNPSRRTTGMAKLINAF